MNQKTAKPTEPGRVLSIDFFRGFVMFVLVTGITGIFGEWVKSGNAGSLVTSINTQFSHGVWYELTFWDLIQPFFMFIVGVAMPFSLAKRLAKGESWNQLLRHALKRSFWLFVLGFMQGSTEKTFSFTNILPQLAFAYPVAFLLMRLEVKWQLVISFVFILISDLLYHLWPVQGYDQLAPAQNFGAWFDLNFIGHLNPKHWVTFNALPTTAHVIWGVITGKFLMIENTDKKRILSLFIAGLIGLAIGFSLDIFIPIIERISTGSYVIVTAGWALIAMAFSYWLVDVMKFTRLAWFFAIIGMNPIFIYLFSSLGGGRIFSRMAAPFTYRLFSWSGPVITNMVTILVITAMFWYLCYFLYKKKIFFKL
jgi:predicted acyltransferase